jgi:hypothetical protein
MTVIVVVVGCMQWSFASWRQHWRAKAEESALAQCKCNLKTLQHTLNCYMFLNEPESMPATLDALVPKFLRTLPYCPSSPSQKYRYARYRNFGCKQFIVSCPGHHKDLEATYPSVFDENFAESPEVAESLAQFEIQSMQYYGVANWTKTVPLASPIECSTFRLKKHLSLELFPNEYKHLFHDPSLRAPQNPAERRSTGPSANNSRPR